MFHPIWLVVLGIWLYATNKIFSAGSVGMKINGGSQVARTVTATFCIVEVSVPFALAIASPSGLGGAVGAFITFFVIVLSPIIIGVVGVIVLAVFRSTGSVSGSLWQLLVTTVIANISGLAIAFATLFAYGLLQGLHGP